MARKAKQPDSQAETGTEGMAEAQPEPFTSAGQETPAASSTATQQATGTQAEPQAQAHTEDQAQAANANSGPAEGGNVSPMPAADPAAELPAALARTRVRDRLIARDDWSDISKLAKEMRSECNRKRMTPEDREDFVWSELDRLYPPLADARQKAQIAPLPSENIEKTAASSQLADSGRVQGLGDLPPGWPELPANASLAVEIGWVQANRLYVVEEQTNGGTRVHLDRAHEPAPSRAAIGWLETSIRSYAKYVEVAAKATGAGQDEQAQERQERMDLDDVRALLAEML